MNLEVWQDGVLRERWDYATRTYTSWDAAGVQTNQRAFTVEENARADAEIAAAALNDNAAALRQQLRDNFATIRTSIDSLQAIVDKTNASIGPADTKDVARECRRVARQVLAMMRVLTGDTSSADTGV